MRNERGFTLMEVLVSIAIMAILGASLTVLLRSSISAWRDSEARSSTNAVAQATLDQLADDFSSACTKPILPPGPVVIEIPTVQHLLKHGIDYYSNEWCTVSLDRPLQIVDKLYARSVLRNVSHTFDFRLRFTTKHAGAWVAVSGDIDLEVKVYTPQNEEDLAGWQALPDNGDLSRLISDATEDGTDRIGIRATFRSTSARLMPGTQGPVLRFVAEPDRAAVGQIRFLLHNEELGESQRVVFVRDLGGKTDPFAIAPQANTSARGLAEVCYLTTADLDDAGNELPARTLWRAVRQPPGNWSEDGDESDPNDESVSLFDRPFISDINALYDAVRANGKVDRQAMADLGFYPIADNVLYFGVEAWRDDPVAGGWVDEWPPAAGTPRKIRIILTLIPQTGPTVARLVEALSGGESRSAGIHLDSASGFRPYAANSAFERYVKIGDEWIYYDNIRGNSLLFDTREIDWNSDDTDKLARLLSDPDRPAENRGHRNTAVLEHKPGEDVYQGDTYIRTILLPYPRQLDIEEVE